MKKSISALLLSLSLSLGFTSSSNALDVLVQNDSDHAIELYVSHTWYKPSFVSEDQKWYYMGPHQSIKVVAHDVYPTRVYMYRLNLSATLSNALYLGGVYTGSVALSVSNALAWIPAAAVVAKTTWNGLPFTKQKINPNAKTEDKKVKTILIENYIHNENTIQSSQLDANLTDVIARIASNIRLKLKDNQEFEPRYDELAERLQADQSSWETYDFVRQLDEDLDTAIGEKIQNAQKKSVKQTIQDLKPIIANIPELKKDYDALQKKQGLEFYIDSVKLAQKIHNLHLGKELESSAENKGDSASDLSEDSLGNASSSSSSSSEEDEKADDAERD